MTRIAHVSTLLAIVAAIAVAGCGGESGSATAGGSGGERTLPSSPPEPAPTATLDVATIPGLGKVLVDSAHKTLYYTDRDKRGSGKSTCYAECARKWWFKAGSIKPIVAPGAELDKSLIGVIRRSEGPQGYLQQTYNGWPLYSSIEETYEEPLLVGSRSFGGTWYPMHPDGTRAGG